MIRSNQCKAVHAIEGSLKWPAMRAMRRKGVVIASVIATLTSIANAGPTIAVHFAGGGQPIAAGSQVSAQVQIRDLGGQLVSGYQAFLQFDPSLMQLQSGVYTAAPFGLPLIAPIAASSGRIDLASGINPLIGQPPTANDCMVATLTFTMLRSTCDVPALRFRAHEPPSRLSAASGGDVSPLTLASWIGLSCLADLNADSSVGVPDLLTVIGSWGNCVASQPCCVGDIDADAVVGVPDLLAVISRWGACSP